ncbi:hypothetical protein AB0N28_10950 [Streptomyces sp. NPDC051130]
MRRSGRDGPDAMARTRRHGEGGPAEAARTSRSQKIAGDAARMWQSGSD